MAPKHHRLPKTVAALLAVAAALVVLGWSAPSWAYPWMIKHEYRGCTPCHADPSGGGLLTEYGRAQGHLLLMTHYSRSTAEQEVPSTAGFAWGLVKPPDSLLLGGGYRGLYMINKRSGAPTDRRYVQMMGDLNAQLAFGGLRLNGGLGFIHEGDLPAAITHRDKDNLISRTHWLGYAFDEDTWLIRAGRMNLPFGVRSIEHTLWVRNATRTDVDATQQHGVAAAYSGQSLRGELMLIAGNYQLNPDAYRERGYSAFAECALSEDAAVGASSLVTYASRDLQLRTKNLRQAHGVFLRMSPVEPLVVLSEADLLATIAEGGSPEFGYAGMLQADVEAIQGVHLMTTGELNKAPQLDSQTAYGAWLSAAWFFLPHMDVRVDAVGRRYSFDGQASTVWVYMTQFHAYL